MNLSVYGQSRVPPGFRFHPTEEELLLYYLKKKVASQKIELDVICEVDLNKLEPWDIQEKCKIGSTPQNDWYLFSHKDKKYPTGTRTNRATAAGFWKATGRDKMIYSSSSRRRRIGMRKTLVFYKGRAPHGHKSDWIMHEYRLEDSVETNASHGHAMGGETTALQEVGWVVCRVFKKKNYHKTLDSSSPMTSTHDTISTTNTSSPQNIHPPNNYNIDDLEGSLEQIFKRPLLEDDHLHDDTHHDHTTPAAVLLPDNPTSLFLNSAPPPEKAMKLQGLAPPIDNPSSLASKPDHNHQQASDHYQLFNPADMIGDANSVYDPAGDMAGFSTDWDSLDRLVACHLNGQSIGECSKQLIISCVDDQGHHDHHNAGVCTSPYVHDHHHQQQHQHDDDNHGVHHLPEMRPPSLASDVLKKPASMVLDCGDVDMDLWSFARSPLMMNTLCHPSS